MNTTHLDIVEATMGGCGFTACDPCREHGYVEEGTVWFEDGGPDDEGEWCCHTCASDKIGARVDRDPMTPGDLAATIFWAFGIDPETVIHDQSQRPHPVARGEPVLDLFA